MIKRNIVFLSNVNEPIKLTDVMDNAIRVEQLFYMFNLDSGKSLNFVNILIRRKVDNSYLVELSTHGVTFTVVNDLSADFCYTTVLLIVYVIQSLIHRSDFIKSVINNEILLS